MKKETECGKNESSGMVGDSQAKSESKGAECGNGMWMDWKDNDYLCQALIGYETCNLIALDICDEVVCISEKYKLGLCKSFESNQNNIRKRKLFGEIIQPSLQCRKRRNLPDVEIV